MVSTEYEVTKAVGELDVGDKLEITSRFGDWHEDLFKLETKKNTMLASKIVITSEETGTSIEEAFEKNGITRLSEDQLASFTKQVSIAE